MATCTRASSVDLRVAAFAWVVALTLWAPPFGAIAASPASGARMARVAAGTYLPLYAAPAPRRDQRRAEPAPRPRVAVAAFDMDVYAVTNDDYLAFVRAHPEWQRSRVKALFADRSYLRHWRGDLDLGDQAPPTSPVVHVSWFAARAYLKASGKTLPTVDQWEYVAAASESKRDASRDRVFLERLRLWYGRPTISPLPAVTATWRNVYGVSGLHGLVWEWTLDFNSALVTGESRADSALDRSLYCGSGGVGASDFEDYASFMRYALRASLEARYTVGNLGFRGVVEHGVSGGSARKREHTR